MDESTKPKKKPEWVFRLYILGGAPNSVKAVETVRAICEEYLKDSYELKLIDILESPLTAVSDGVVAAPTLLKLYPAPLLRITGDLSDKKEVVRKLGLEEDP